jgi:ABC-2 type transport system permease protein
MTLFILGLTIRQLAGRKSTLLLLALCAVPLLLAAIFRLSDPDIDSERWVANTLMLGLVITLVLPLTTLLLGASVLGDELEDGTVAYLLTKPLARWQILLPKLAASWLVALALILPPRALIGGLIYVFVWEGAITSIFAGTRYLSIRHAALGIAGDLAGASPAVFDPYVNGTTALVLIAFVTLAAGYYANLRLRRLELREPH